MDNPSRVNDLGTSNVTTGVQGLEQENAQLSFYHNDSTKILIQRELIFPKHLVEKAAQTSLPLKSYFPSYYHPHAGDSKFIEHAAAVYDSLKGYYYGTKATINVWNHPNIKSNQSSSAFIWIGNAGDSIEVGWQVFPQYYHDTATHFYIFWTADGSQKTRCLNLDCPGFIFANKSLFVPGNKLLPVSKYEGEQYYITLKIYKDPQTGDWLLFEGRENAPNFVGYWPKSLFNALDKIATHIFWGGSVSYENVIESPPMGSGYFSEEGERRAASFKHVQYVNYKGTLFDPRGNERRVATKGGCYNTSPFVNSDKHGEADGWKFYFGGPGGCKN